MNIPSALPQFKARLLSLQPEPIISTRITLPDAILHGAMLPGYSTESVAQHTFAMLFYLLEKLRYYDDYVKEERYVNDTIFTHFAERFCQINGKTWGIIGLGNIGRRVADIAKAFGADVIYYSTSGSNTQDGYTRTDFDTLLATSDIISVHAPLTPNTERLIDAKALSKMKPSAIFLNLGRGPIVVEEDLADALESGQIAGRRSGRALYRTNVCNKSAPSDQRQ